VTTVTVSSCLKDVVRVCRLGLNLTLLLAGCFAPASAQGQASAPEGNSDIARLMSRSIENLARRVSPAVVEVLVTGYGSANEEDSQASAAVGRERSLGAGVIVDPNGYVITNYHVVKGSDRVRVVLTASLPEGSQPFGLLKSRGRTIPAQIVGYSKQIDVAVLKIDATGLPTLPIGRYEQVQKGEIVLAFGSPIGLENSVSFGLISSVLRQPDPDNPMIYIQTDAAINPGNSGGPLMDLDGNMIGINTFIYTKSGGNEGIGFAIPSGIVRYAYEQIRKYGRVKRRTIGADLQSLTPDLAQGLNLSIEDGVIVSDVPPDSTAERAGLKIGDVIVSMDGIPVDNVPLFALSLYMQDATDNVVLEVIRGNKKLQLKVPVYEPNIEPDQLSELANPAKDLISRLGIVGLTISPENRQYLGDMRIPSGVYVASIVADQLAVDSGLSVGDVVHSLKGVEITNVESLRAEFGRLKPGEAATMQVERNGRLTYVTFEME
jgi:serine protease Do